MRGSNYGAYLRFSQAGAVTLLCFKKQVEQVSAQSSNRTSNQREYCKGKRSRRQHNLKANEAVAAGVQFNVDVLFCVFNVLACSKKTGKNGFSTTPDRNVAEMRILHLLLLLRACIAAQKG